MSESCGYGCDDRNVNVAWGSTGSAGASELAGVMSVGGGADSVRTGDAVLVEFKVVENRVAL